MTSRPATHAGSWYSASGAKLSQQLDGWLAQVPSEIDGVGSLPRPGARIIIAPHAGYAYSGPAAAWAYRCLDFSKAERIFLLGPSHHVHLARAALSAHSSYDTPLGPLPLDRDTIASLAASGTFTSMSADTDAEEHSLEMHLPYIYKLLSLHFPTASAPPPPSSDAGTGRKWPLLVPLLVPSLSPSATTSLARLLVPYLRQPGSIFILSSDFCHWGLRFQYTYYLPSLSLSPSSASFIPPKGIRLTPASPRPTNPPIHASIAALDRSTMAAITSGSYDALVDNLKETGNTVCGRYPIGVVLRALELARAEEGEGEGKGPDGEAMGKFRFVRYERSSDPVEVGDSSVSYASAFAVL